MTESINAAPDTPASIWEELSRAVTELDHPWRTPVLATSDGTVRTVVLRSASQSLRNLVFYTDLRSPKIAPLSRSPRVEWLFYNPRLGVQVRALATATVDAGNETAKAAWSGVPTANRANYCSLHAPGMRLPTDGADDAPPPGPSEAGYGNFAVVTTLVASFDWLHLSPGGNRRRLLEFDHASDQWTATPVVP